jgi:hypothetical protein
LNKSLWPNAVAEEEEKKEEPETGVHKEKKKNKIAGPYLRS